VGIKIGRFYDLTKKNDEEIDGELIERLLETKKRPSI